MKLRLILIAAALSACTATLPADDSGNDRAPFVGSARSHAAAVFERGANCTADCFEAMARSGADYDARKKAHVAGVTP